MKRFLLLMLAVIGLAPFAAGAQTHAFTDVCYQGGVKSVTSGLGSTNYLDGVIPSCQVRVYLTGTTTLAPIYAAATGTGSVAGVMITAGGTYSVCPTGVTFSGGGGTGAAGFPTCTGTAITGVSITNAGTGYTTPPAVAFTGGTGSGGIATSSLAQTLSNPFTATALGSAAPGQWLFYAADNQAYDVVMSGGIAPNVYTQPVTITGLYHGSPGSGGGGSGCSPSATANSVLYSPSGTNCAGDNAFTYNGKSGGGGPVVLLNQGNKIEVDGVDDSNGIFINGDQILVHNFGSDSASTMIPFTANQSDSLYVGVGDLIVDYDAIYEIDHAGKDATGFLTEPHVGVGVAAGTFAGFKSGAPNVSGTLSKSYGFLADGAGIAAITEEFSFYANTAADAEVNSDYCDFMARTQEVSPVLREKIGCGSTHASTFSGPVTLASITGSTQCLHVDSSGTITGTGSDCGGGGGGVTSINGTPGPFTFNGTGVSCIGTTCTFSVGGITGSGTTGFLPKWSGSTALGNSAIDDGVTTPATVTSTEPIAVAAASLPSQIGLTYNAGHAPTVGSATTAVYAVDSSGNAAISEAGAAYSRPCTAANGICVSNPNTCTANTALVKCLGVSPYLAISGDWSVAINQAITDLASTGGTIFGCGTYPVNGSPLDPSGANALINMPSIASVNGFTNVTITLQGCQPTTPNISALSGMTFVTSVNTSGVNFIGGYRATGSTFGHFTAVKLVMDHANVISTVAVPAINLINAANINALMLNDVLLSGTSCTLPVSGTGGTGLITPNILNNFEVNIENVVISCMANAALIHEHAQLSNLWTGSNHNCIQFDSQDAANNGNAIGGDQIWMQSCVNYVLGPSSSNPTSISLTRVEMESDPGTGFDILDASNMLHGHIAYKKTSPSTGITVSGAANLSSTNLNDSTEAIASASQTVQALSGTHASGVGMTLGGSAAGTDTWGLYSLSSGVSVGHALGLLNASQGNWAQLWNMTGLSGPGYVESPNFVVLGWSPTVDVTLQTMDTGISRGAAGVVDVGNGSPSDASGTLKAATGTFGTGLTVGGNNVCQSTGTNCPTKPVQISSTFVGVPANSQIMYLAPATVALTVPSGCTNSAGTALVAATGSTAFLFKDLTTSTTLCTITYSASGTTGAPSGSGGSVSAGDVLEIIGPATADATLATVGVSIYATR